MQKIIIAIDGYSGTGKSSTAKAVARNLGYTYIDSGAMYRAATLYFLQQGVDLEKPQEVAKALAALDISFEGQDLILNEKVVRDELRTMAVNDQVSQVSAVKSVREALVEQQQAIGQDRGIVMDGRDIGTVVFPDAELKVFMTANSRVRALRRQRELEQKGIREELNVIEENLKQRDQIDSTREESPLTKALGAVEIDTSDLSFDEQVGKIVELAKKKIYAS
ncbi:(d)CMP kinase [Marinoscillum furvescens]|uniref:Cytidylate kinase n=1 Tax=Marinoscillum furvescens DSM 4134 TaxID=1122208 RepID=A0A3D9KX64_MARFU|nr:(d)CMP kinase [Marinoscillum furvescens]RED93188.1 cytidylate kinase [Marinoscillum furvescens DSM 4134]